MRAPISISVASFALPSDVPTNAMYLACVKAEI